MADHHPARSPGAALAALGEPGRPGRGVPPPCPQQTWRQQGTGWFIWATGWGSVIGTSGAAEEDVGIGEGWGGPVFVVFLFIVLVVVVVIIVLLLFLLLLLGVEEGPGLTLEELADGGVAEAEEVVAGAGGWWHRPGPPPGLPQGLEEPAVADVGRGAHQHSPGLVLGHDLAAGAGHDPAGVQAAASRPAGAGEEAAAAEAQGQDGPRPHAADTQAVHGQRPQHQGQGQCPAAPARGWPQDVRRRPSQAGGVLGWSQDGRWWHVQLGATSWSVQPPVVS